MPERKCEYAKEKSVGTGGATGDDEKEKGTASVVQKQKPRLEVCTADVL